MNGLTFLQPKLLAALLAIPLLFALFRRAQLLREAQLNGMGSKHAPELVQGIQGRKRKEYSALAAVALIVLALAHPVCNPHEASNPEGGRDIVFVLDVSRSMLAQDVRPSRLKRAKADIAACLKTAGNDRVGLIAFAGNSSILSPLTTDTGFLGSMLENASPDSVALGSTYLQSALEKATEKMLPADRKGLQDIILFTDGEDQGSHPEKTVEGLNAAGARLLVIGYGDPQFGSRIPVEDQDGAQGFLMDQKQEVWTKLCEEPLRGLAGASVQGKYVRGGTADFDLGRVYRQWSMGAPRRFLNGRGEIAHTELFPWLLAPALVLLLFPLPWGARKSRRLAGALAIAGLLLPAAVRAEEPEPAGKYFQQGVELMKKQNPSEAADAFDKAAAIELNSSRLAVALFDAGLAYGTQANGASSPDAQLEDLDNAIDRFRRALLLNTEWASASQALEVLYNRRTETLKAVDQQQSLSKQLQALIAELQRLAHEQQRIADRAFRFRPKLGPTEELLKALGTDQILLNPQTESAKKRLSEIDSKFRELLQPLNAKVPKALLTTGFEEALDHLGLARTAQEDAASKFGPLPQWHPASNAAQTAKKEINAALESLTAKNNNSGQGEPKDNDEESDDSSQSDSSPNQSLMPGGDLHSDPTQRELPKPNFSEQEIFDEEKANEESRAKKPPNRVGAGEKDW